MTALLVKESVNQTVDNMGFYNALNACFTLHQLNHGHWAEAAASGIPFTGIQDWRSAAGVRFARKTEVQAEELTR